MLWFGKKNKVISAFAKTMAQEFFSNFPPTFIAELKDQNKKTAQKAKRQYERVMSDIVKNVIQFKKTNNLKVYGKAKFHLEFSSHLNALGYEELIAKEISNEIMIKSP